MSPSVPPTLTKLARYFPLLGVRLLQKWCHHPDQLGVDGAFALDAAELGAFVPEGGVQEMRAPLVEEEGVAGAGEVGGDGAREVGGGHRDGEGVVDDDVGMGVCAARAADG